jgi:hypothetical protein
VHSERTDDEEGSVYRKAEHYIAPAEPQQNGFVESFNGGPHNELLNKRWSSQH